ncbi:hypothetical protein GOODEAATRI_013630, partial [Goodea atripinnis]
VFSAVSKAWEDGPYLFIVKVQPMSRGVEDEDIGTELLSFSFTSENRTFGAEFFRCPHTVTDRFFLNSPVNVEMKGPHDYSSPADWPLMIVCILISCRNHTSGINLAIFFMVMCIVYVLFGALWLFWCACYWRDLLRIQFWIGAVIILGMLEKAVFYSEYQSIRYKGDYGRACLLECGGFYGTVALVANLSLSLIDSCVMWWISFFVPLKWACSSPFMDSWKHCAFCISIVFPCVLLRFSLISFYIFISLSQTTRLLKLRRNVVKLSLYQHFTNTLVFFVVGEFDAGLGKEN